MDDADARSGGALGSRSRRSGSGIASLEVPASGQLVPDHAASAQGVDVSWGVEPQLVQHAPARSPDGNRDQSPRVAGRIHADPDPQDRPPCRSDRSLGLAM
jgi:hypothetical protein